MTEVKQGTQWGGSDGNLFHVINVIDLEGHTWVHYQQDNIDESRLFSCWVESFVARFKPVFNEAKG